MNTNRTATTVAFFIALGGAVRRIAAMPDAPTINASAAEIALIAIAAVGVLLLIASIVIAVRQERRIDAAINRRR